MAARQAPLPDAMLLIRQGGADAGGEDSYVCAQREGSALVGVFDGCGGLGARTYPDMGKHTGAYLSARAASGAVWDWYQALEQSALADPDRLTETLRARLDTAPLAHREPEGVAVDLFWAGDSRVYLLDAAGLHQLTQDDVDGEDALSNLTHDAAMTNVISSDGQYALHHRRMTLSIPCAVFAATDGVFGYIRTPMEFEWLLLRVLREAETPKQFTSRLEQLLDALAGDDFTLAWMSFGFGDFSALRETLTPRIPMLERDYIRPLHAARTDALQAELWERYRSDYERALTAKGGGA